MKLHTKVALGVLPPILLSLAVLGFWTIRSSAERIETSVFLQMQTILDTYIIDKVNGYHELLRRSHQESDESLVAEYQRRSAEDAVKIPLSKTGRIFALTDAGKLVFCSRADETCENLEPLWGNTAIQMARGEERGQGHIHTDFGNYVYVARYFAPWKWSLFYAVSDRDVHDVQHAIRNITLLIAGLCAAALWLAIPLVFRRMFIEPIRALQAAAAAIAGGEEIERIPINSDDELGSLSRTMERMALAVREHRREQAQWQEQLERQVQAQTANFHKEIEERKNAEELLRAERDLVSHIMETSPVGITTVNRQGQLTFANSRAEQILGLTKDKITQRDYNATEWRITDYDGQPFPEDQLPFTRVLREKANVIGVRHAIEWPNGRRVLLEIHAAPLFDESGALTGVVAILDDVTEKVEALRALRASEAKFHSLYTSMNEGVVLHELLTDESGNPQDYRILDANPMFEEFTGVKRLTAVGKKASEVYGVSPAPYLERYAAVAQSGDSTSFETYFPPLDRHYRISVFSPERGKFATVFSDISEQKRVEEKIRKVNVELEQRVAERTAELEVANRELRHFIYAASHDLKTPLYGINRLAYWLGEDYAEAFDENGKELISMLIQRTRRLNQMLDGILEYSSVGRSGTRRVEISLPVLANTLFQQLDPPASLRMIVEDDLPPVSACEESLTTVLRHLLQNAMMFMGKDEGEIRLDCVEQQDCWLLSVSDDGPGIDPKYHEKIFQIFQTLHFRDQIESCGIGLALVKKIVESSGGMLWIESTVGEGSTFFFTLPK